MKRHQDKVSIALSIFAIAFVFSCNQQNNNSITITQEETIDNTLSNERILKDISEIDEREFEYFLKSEHYQTILERNAEIEDSYTKFFYKNQCIIHVNFFKDNYVLPLEYCNYESILLFYRRKDEDTSSWYLDTVINTFPEFERINENANYYKVGYSRCKLGYCQWYYTILQIEEDAKINSLYEIYSWDRYLRLEDLLSDGNTEALLNEIGDTIANSNFIEEYNWEGNQLKSILVTDEIKILKNIASDTLDVESIIGNRLIEW